ncbi:MAG: ABC transporter ATP-binding protein [Acidimicrobiales bacterium]
MRVVEATKPDRAESREEPEVLVAVEDLRCHFGGVRAVDGASFAVERGKVMGLIGPNGAGKSTALKAIGGAVPSSRGSVQLEGTELLGRRPHQVARLGVIRSFQLGGEFGRLTVMENLLVAAPRPRGEGLAGALLGRRWWGRAEAALVDRARELLARFDMDAHENEYAANLSGGQRRIVEICRALMAGPRILLLDEPMAGVNRSMARRIEACLLDLREEGLTMLLVEHELGTVERLCDAVVVMALGKVIAQGSMGGLREREEVLSAYLAG